MSIKTILGSTTVDIENFSGLLDKEDYQKKSVVYFTADIPIEIITAAGLIPVRIPSDVKGNKNQSNIQSVSTSALQPYICSKSHQFFDFISKNGKKLIAGVFSENHCDSLQNFYDVLKMNKTLDPDFPHFRFLLPIKRGGPTETKYYFQENLRLISWLEDLTGDKINFEKLLNAITLHNTKRSLLMQISNYIGATDPRKIVMSEFIKLKLATDIIPVEEGVDMLYKVTKTISDMNVDDEQVPKYPRVLISGSMFDNYTLFESIDQLNRASVATDLSFISRSSDFQISLHNQIEENVEPQEINKSMDKSCDTLLMNLAEAYIMKRIPDSVHHSPGRRRDYLIDQIKNNQIDGVIFIHYSFCDPDAFESRSLSYHLKNEMDLPTLILVTDPQLTNLNQMITRVEAFLEKIGDY